MSKSKTARPLAEAEAIPYVRAQRDALLIQTLNEEVAQLNIALATLRADPVQRAKDEEIERLRGLLSLQTRMAENERDGARDWIHIDHVHRAMMQLSRIEPLETTKLAKRVLERQGLRPMARLHLNIIDHLMPWLAQYSAALREAMGLTPDGPPPSIIPFSTTAGQRRLAALPLEDCESGPQQANE